MKPGQRRSTPAGFTLIEVLLTSVLAATLLAALWTLLSMHLKMFDTGQTRTEQSQLARTLLQQISDDLQSVVQPPPPVPPLPVLAAAMLTGGASKPAATSSGNANAMPKLGPTTTLAPAPQSSSANAAGNTTSTTTTAGSPATASASGQPPMGAANPSQQSGANSAVAVTSSLRPSGLFGTENSLQIDILQATAVAADDSQERAAPGAIAPSRAAELRTVVYSFQESRDPHHPLGEPHMCLTRREIDWEQSHPAGKNASVRRPGQTGITARTESGPIGAPEPLETQSDATFNASSASVPEVMQFAMRYFDGTAWSAEWDSAARGGLPVAVEVAMQLRSFEENDPQANHAEPQAHHAEPQAHRASGGDAASEDARPRQANLPIYRLVVHLPLAKAQANGFGQAGPSARGAEPPLSEDSHGPRR
jgi:prepilin-type N-terminal cleavage/methylation domain-containing protein